MQQPTKECQHKTWIAMTNGKPPKCARCGIESKEPSTDKSVKECEYCIKDEINGIGSHAHKSEIVVNTPPPIEIKENDVYCRRNSRCRKCFAIINSLSEDNISLDCDCSCHTKLKDYHIKQKDCLKTADGGCANEEHFNTSPPTLTRILEELKMVDGYIFASLKSQNELDYFLSSKIKEVLESVRVEKKEPMLGLKGLSKKTELEYRAGFNHCVDTYEKLKKEILTK